MFDLSLIAIANSVSIIGITCLHLDLYRINWQMYEKYLLEAGLYKGLFTDKEYALISNQINMELFTHRINLLLLTVISVRTLQILLTHLGSLYSRQVPNIRC